jgi:hypothetical protein
MIYSNLLRNHVTYQHVSNPRVYFVLAISPFLCLWWYKPQRSTASIFSTFWTLFVRVWLHSLEAKSGRHDNSYNKGQRRHR